MSVWSAESAPWPQDGAVVSRPISSMLAVASAAGRRSRTRVLLERDDSLLGAWRLRRSADHGVRPPLAEGDRIEDELDVLGVVEEAVGNLTGTGDQVAGRGRRSPMDHSL